MNCKNKDHVTYRGKLIITTELLNGDSKWQKVLYTYVADCKTLQLPIQTTIFSKTFKHNRWRKIRHSMIKIKFNQYQPAIPTLQKLLEGKSQPKKLTITKNKPQEKNNTKFSNQSQKTCIYTPNTNKTKGKIISH